MTNEGIQMHRVNVDGTDFHVNVDGMGSPEKYTFTSTVPDLQVGDNSETKELHAAEPKEKKSKLKLPGELIRRLDNFIADTEIAENEITAESFQTIIDLAKLADIFGDKGDKKLRKLRDRVRDALLNILERHGPIVDSHFYSVENKSPDPPKQYSAKLIRFLNQTDHGDSINLENYDGNEKTVHELGLHDAFYVSETLRHLMAGIAIRENMKETGAEARVKRDRSNARVSQRLTEMSGVKSAEDILRIYNNLLKISPDTRNQFS